VPYKILGTVDDENELILTIDAPPLNDLRIDLSLLSLFLFDDIIDPDDDGDDDDNTKNANVVINNNPNINNCNSLFIEVTVI
jgi:hypothetical protein